jgi:hypothetical protein
MSSLAGDCLAFRERERERKKKVGGGIEKHYRFGGGV